MSSAHINKRDSNKEFIPSITLRDACSCEGAAHTDPISAADRQKLLHDWNNTAHAWSDDPCLHEIVERQAECAPNSIAVICGDNQITYAELNEQARRVACRLVSLGVEADEPVGVVANLTIDSVVGLVGILKAGGAYLPLDHSFPAERISFYLTDANVRFIVGDINNDCIVNHPNITVIPAKGLPDFQGVSLPKVSPESLAYVLFTSGSTGNPKGVMLNHRGPVNTVRDVNQRFGITAEDRVLALSSLGFDLSVYDLFGMFSAGAAFVQPTVNESRNPEHWLELIQKHGVTVWNSVPALMDILVTYLDGSATLESLKCVMLSGDWIPVTLPDRIRAVAPQCNLISLGGSTEASIWSTVYAIGDVAKTWNSIPYGKPLLNQTCYVLDEEQILCPIGEVGELCIGGVGLAVGYLNRAELTASHFVPDPFSPGKILYRTGDLCRTLPDGNLELLGRKDHQVKIRGYRIELGEIEARMLQHEAIREVVVIASKEEAGPRLLGYIVFRGEKSVSLADLNTFLSSGLPDYMLPAALIPLPQLPLTANGKVNRKELPLPTAEREQPDLLLPATKTEAIIAETLCDLLGLDKLDVRDDYFSLGGNSLLAVTLVIRLKAAFGVRLSYPEVLAESPNTRQLAGMIEVALQSQQPAQAELPAISAERLTEAPVSFPQQQLWMVNFLERNRARYNVPLCYQTEGPLDQVALQSALNAVVARHDILRTVYDSRDAGLVQRVLADWEFGFKTIDLQATTEGDRQATFQAKAVAFASIPFDLQAEIPIRAALFTLSPTNSCLVIVVHHIAIDGHSIDLLHRELSSLYTSLVNRNADSPPEPQYQYANFSVWQNRDSSTESCDLDRQYWRQKLSGDLPILNLPHDKGALDALHNEKKTEGKTLSIRIQKEALAAVRDYSAANQTTLFVTLLAAIKATLYRYTGQEDIMVGSAVSTRDEAATEDQIGYFINVLPLRTQFCGSDSFESLLAKVRETALEALAHKDFPFEWLKREFLSSQAAGEDPFQVMFVLENEPRKLEIAGTNVRQLPLNTETAKFDLLIAAFEADDTLRIDLEYRCNTFDERRIHQFGEHLQNILAETIKAPATPLTGLKLLTDPQRTRLLSCAGNTTSAKQNLLLPHDLFAKRAAQTPNAVAVRLKDKHLTYEELNARANLLAGKLVLLGVNKNAPVGIRICRSPEMLVAVLAVLKAGGAYVPIDPALPAVRQQTILQDCQANVLLTSSGLAEKLIGDFSQDRVVCIDEFDFSHAKTAACPSPGVSADDLAYILYTSGSTGEPKGVAMRHGAVANLIEWQLRNSEAGLGTRTLQFASLGFDVSFQEIFATLCSGGELHLVREEIQQDLNQLWKFTVAERIERIFVPFVVLRSFAAVAEGSEHAASDSALREVITAGEQVQITPAVREFFRQMPNCRLWNHYGPTETHVATAYCLPEDLTRWPKNPAIGLPIDNCIALVLDQRMQPVAPGVNGELYLGGACLAQGYYHRDDLTADRFVANPHTELNTDRLYRTGDICRLNWEGQLEFLGRNDNQVKIRGNRVELAEIEIALGQLPGVKHAIVLKADDDLGSQLVAYIVPDSVPPKSSELADELSRRLPAYMVPSQFCLVKEFPKTSSGKVDRNRLVGCGGQALPTDSQPDVQVENCADPANPWIDRIIEVWIRVLKTDQITAQSDFFACGGNSLSAAIFFSRMEREFGRAVSITKLLECPTVAQLAATFKIADDTDRLRWENMIPLQTQGDQSPLFCLPGIDGHLLNFRELASIVGKDRPVYGLEPVGLDGQSPPLCSVREIARVHIEEIRRALPEGPYHVVGFSFGGLVAYEIAQQLRKQGEKVTLAMIDAWAGVPKSATWPQSLKFHFRVFQPLQGREKFNYFMGRVKGVTFAALYNLNLISMEQRLKRIIDLDGNYPRVAAANMQALREYRPSSSLGGATLYRAKLRPTRSKQDNSELFAGWDTVFAPDQIQVVEVEGAHAGMLSASNVQGLAEHLRQSLKIKRDKPCA